jgi:hypothetical protein
MREPSVGRRKEGQFLKLKGTSLTIYQSLSSLQKAMLACKKAVWL